MPQEVCKFLKKGHGKQNNFKKDRTTLRKIKT